MYAKDEWFAFGRKNMYRILVGKHLGKRPIGKPSVNVRNFNIDNK
jgi:hypothetical protein